MSKKYLNDTNIDILLKQVSGQNCVSKYGVSHAS
jgi:hypothetical protein